MHPVYSQVGKDFDKLETPLPSKTDERRTVEEKVIKFLGEVKESEQAEQALNARLAGIPMSSAHPIKEVKLEKFNFEQFFQNDE